MVSAITLKCANCGAGLEITWEMNSFACGYCGASQQVERKGGTVSLQLIENAIGRVQIGTDKTAAELALKRLANDLATVEQNNKNLQVKKNKELEFNRKLFFVIWVVGIVICCMIATGGTAAAVLAFLVGAAGSVCVLYLGFKQSNVIEAKYKVEFENMTNQYNSIKKKIAGNRALVDNQGQ